MARLPQQGSDNNQWGEILNDFLKVSHNADGSLRAAATAPTAPQRGEVSLSVKDAPFLAKGDGSTDDTTAIKAAFDAANSAGKPLFFPPGRYVCSWFYKAYPPRVWAEPGTVTILASNTNDCTWNFGATSYGPATGLTADAAAGTRTLQVATTSGLAADDLIVIKDTATDFGVAQAQTVRIYSVDSGAQLTLAEPVCTTFTVGAAATIQLLPRNQQGCYIQGFSFKLVAPATSTAGFVRLWYCRDVDISVEGEGATNPGIIIEGCYQFRVKAVARRYADQTITGLPQFGYGVNISGPSAHGMVDIIADQVRHAVSMNGPAHDVRITGIAHGTTNTAWDAHPGATNIVFDNCQAVGCQSFGFGLRGKRQHVQGGLVDSCYGGVFVFDSPGENQITGVRISRLRDTGSGDGNRGNGILVSNPSTGLVIRGNEIDNCTRNGISFRAVGTSTDVVVADNIIRNVGKGLYANDRCGIQQLSSARFAQATIRGNIIKDNQSGVTTQYGIQMTGTGNDVTIQHNEFYNGITPFNGSGVQGVAKIGSNSRGSLAADNVVAVPFASAMVLDASLGATLHCTLTGNVTSSSVTGASEGHVLRIVVTQDATGGRSFAWPPSVTWQGPAPMVNTAAGASSAYSFVYIAAAGSWVALGASGSGGASQLAGVGLLAARPAATAVDPGERYFATDAGVEYISDGTTWHATAGATSTQTGLLSARPAASGGNIGTRYFATNYGREYYSDGSTWHIIGPDEAVLFGGHVLQSGEAVMSRTQATTTVTLSNTLIRFTYFTAAITEAVTQLRFFVAAAATGTAPTMCRAGVYQVDGSGNLTLLAAIANDTTLYSATGAVTRTLTSTFNKVRGQRYAVALLCVTTGTQPTVAGANLNSAVEAAIAPKISGSVGGSGDLQANYTAAGVAAAAALVQTHLLP